MNCPSHLVVSVHAAGGEFCSQGLVWEVRPCLLLSAAAERLLVSDAVHPPFASWAQWEGKPECIFGGWVWGGTEGGTKTRLLDKVDLSLQTVWPRRSTSFLVFIYSHLSFTHEEMEMFCRSVLKDQWIRAKYERREFTGENNQPSYCSGNQMPPYKHIFIHMIL